MFTELRAEVRAERDVVRDHLRGIPDEVWGRGTLMKGWTVRDVVSHLVVTDAMAVRTITEQPSDFSVIRDAAGEISPLPLPKTAELAAVPAEAVREAFETCSDAALAALDAIEADHPVLWGGGPMKAMSFATSRLMEYWVHGLDVLAASGLESEPTARLRHVAYLGYRTLGYAFRRAGVEGHDPRRLRLELEAPDGGTWVFGPDDTDEVIRGSALEWCLVAVRRRTRAKTSLVGTGPLARAALKHARAYA